MDAIDRAIDVLNRFAMADPAACTAFLKLETTCNRALAEDATIQIGQSGVGGCGGFRVRPLGLINGLFGTIEGGPKDGFGHITVRVESDDRVIEFVRTESLIK